jgi:hypothetical protein
LADAAPAEIAHAVVGSDNEVGMTSAEVSVDSIVSGAEVGLVFAIGNSDT